MYLHNVYKLEIISEKNCIQLFLKTNNIIFLYNFVYILYTYNICLIIHYCFLIDPSFIIVCYDLEYLSSATNW